MILKRKQIGNSTHLGLVIVVMAIATLPVAGQDPAIRVVSSGDVGIGTDNPDSKLHIVDGNDDGNFHRNGSILSRRFDCVIVGFLNEISAYAITPHWYCQASDSLPMGNGMIQ